MRNRNTIELLGFWESVSVPTTKKAYCQALDIPFEAACRYKRAFEKRGLLVQSSYKIVCPYTGHLAHLISTNPIEFDNLKRIKIKQLSLF